MKLFIPGPVNVDKKILKEMSHQMLGHRSKEFKALHQEIIQDIKELLKTDNNVLILTSSATGAMEAAIRNVVNNKVLCLANGAFGKRWHEISKSNGKEAKLIDFGDGKPYDFNVIEEELKNDYEAITVILNETSTGIENDIEHLKEILKNYPQTLLLVDAVTGVFGTNVKLEGIDVLLFGTQKALALPPGLAIVIVNDRAMEKSNKVENKGFYFDFIKAIEKAKENLTLTTPNIPLMFALKAQLKEIKSSGINKWIEKHEKNTEAVREFFTKKGFKLLVDEKNKSKTITVIESNNIDVEDLIKHLKSKGFEIANGYGSLKNKTFRISHMGVSYKDTIELLGEIDNFLQNYHKKLNR